MSGLQRFPTRNAAIQDMLSDGDKIKNFYRFAAQNPHIERHDVCQIILERPNASICFSFDEWHAMGRRITKGRKGIPYIDRDGNKQLVFDAADTHGEERYKRLILPMKRLLDGLDVLNGTHLADDPRADYRKIHSGVASYMREMEMFGDDEKRNNLMLEGVSYSLYCRTGFPKNTGIPIHGFP